MEQVVYQDLGRMDYQQAWDCQRTLHEELLDRKRRNKGLQPGDPNWEPRHHYLLFCDHPPVYTLGKSGSEDHLLINAEERAARGVQYYKINRGGDITYHGPGQIVGYPIFDLEGFFTDVHRYVRTLEEAVILMLAGYGIDAIRVDGYTGVWIPGNPARKICAIGVHLSRWVSMHGFALNVNPDLRYFEYIIPCGIADKDKTVTSMERELGQSVDIEEVKSTLRELYARLFGFNWLEVPAKHINA
jgi:lipoyl(octanoyl) transferase